MINEGIVLGHHLSSRGIKLNKYNIKIITLLPTPLKPKDVRRFLGHEGYYGRFIKDFSKIASHLLSLPCFPNMYLFLDPKLPTSF
jgi:hypothetical protein